MATQTPTGQNWHTDANQISAQSTNNRQTYANQIPTQSTGTNASNRRARMQSKLITQTLTEQIRHTDAFITFVTQTQITEYKGVSVKRGPDTCGWRMRMRKCGKNKTRNADGKNKQTNKQRKEIFLSSFCRMVGPFMYRTLCQ